jgi:hypothetical protein
MRKIEAIIREENKIDIKYNYRVRPHPPCKST